MYEPRTLFWFPKIPRLRARWLDFIHFEEVVSVTATGYVQGILQWISLAIRYIQWALFLCP